MKPLVHARILRSVFRKILLTSIVLPAVGSPFLFACTGGGGSLDDGSESENGTGTGVSGSGGGGENGTGTTSGTGVKKPGTTDIQKPCSAIPTDAPACGNYTVDLTGDLTTCEFDSTGVGSAEYCKEICGDRAFTSGCKRSGSSVSCNAPCAIDGRRYTALDDRSAPAASDIGSYLARMAFFEAASVDSFLLLERELKMHRAPTSLLRSCAQARRDETKHTRMATRLAKCHGGRVVAPPMLQASPLRELEEIAIENAVEGCIRETFGVLIGLWQAEHAPTRALRAFFATLANDEARHAALAARIDAWLLPRLSESARDRVEAARARAVEMLEASLTTSPIAGLGLPTAAHARALFDHWQRASNAHAVAA